MAMVCVYGSGECDGCMRCQAERRENVIAVCPCCREEVRAYEDRYEFPDGDIVHEDCARDYIREHYYRKGE